MTAKVKSNHPWKEAGEQEAAVDLLAQEGANDDGGGGGGGDDGGGDGGGAFWVKAQEQVAPLAERQGTGTVPGTAPWVLLEREPEPPRVAIRAWALAVQWAWALAVQWGRAAVAARSGPRAVEQRRAQ